MTKKKKEKYENVEELKKIIQSLKGRKFKLDCHHHISFGCFLGNSITIYNGKHPTIICSQCGH